jgi:membrane-associated phospholipid phosphatase
VVLMAAARVCALHHFVADTAVGAALGIICALALRQHLAGVERWLAARVAPGPATR